MPKAFQGNHEKTSEINMDEIFGTHEGQVDGSYVSRMLDLTLLAPDIIDAILDGKETSGLSLTTLTKKQIPPLWEEQRKIFGFTAKDEA